MGRTVFEVLGFVRSSQARDVPDLQVHVLPWSYPFPNQDAPVRHKVDKRCALTIMPTLIYPKSRGTLRLASADPSAAPVIDPGYLTEPDDSRLLLDGMELIREVMASKIIADRISLELSPGPGYPDRASLARELPNRATSVFHAVGSCRIGADERAVVDPALRVRGVDGAPRRRRLGHARHHRREHERPGDDDRRALRQPHDGEPGGRGLVMPNKSSCSRLSATWSAV